MRPIGLGQTPIRELEMRMSKIEPSDQAPARMAFSKSTSAEMAAVDHLVEHGVSHERANELVRVHGTQLDTLRAATWIDDAAKPDMQDAD